MSSIFQVDPSDIETFTVVTHPIRSYVSSSTTGVTGSVYVFARRSEVEKDAQPDSSFVESKFDNSHLVEVLRQAQWLGRTSRYVPDNNVQFDRVLDQYMSKVNSTPTSRRKRQVLDVVRFTPPAKFNSNTLRKLVVKDMLQPYYRTSYPSAHWAYTNYNTLNFFTASTVPTSSVLLYPNYYDETVEGHELVFHEGYVSGTYTPSGSFSFDFYINPRYTSDAADGAFKAGTILHLSSTFALSLISGSSKDVNGHPTGFRLQLQLSQSADIPPSQAIPGMTVNDAPGDLVFLSDDNVLWHNCWHHVVIRWGTKDVNAGLGSFNVDGVDRGTFLVPSATIAPRINDQKGNPDVLCVGNFYEGDNIGENAMALFFAEDPATRDGLTMLVAGPGVEEPAHYAFNHPLNAEIHDLAIRRCYMSDIDIAFSASRGPSFLDDTFAMYLPPFFMESSPFRQFVGDHGGILITPFEEVDGSTASPFGIALSFGVGGHYINLENFVMDFASLAWPRLHHLTASTINVTTDAETCNQFLYSQPFVVKRNLTILPCDDGLFVPNFQLLTTWSQASMTTYPRHVDDLGIEEMSFVHLDNLVHSATLLFGGGTFDDGNQPDDKVNDFANLQIGATPETPFVVAGPAMKQFLTNMNRTSDRTVLNEMEIFAPLTIYQRTQDPSSNQVTFFDVSNLFYGFRIKPGTLRLMDPYLSGSSGAITITLKDDGHGNVYRADCLTSASTWNSVGNIYYDEGLIVLKNPHVFFFGQDHYELTFRGEQHVHVMKVDALAPNNALNISTNPNYKELPPNGYPNDPEKKFVYITGLNFHDSDYNVVMKSQLAQPIAKRAGDRLMFKIRYDW